MLKHVTLSFHGLSSPSVNAPWERASKGNPEPHNAPVQAEEVRAVITPFPLRPGFQIPEMGNRQMVRREQGIKRGQRIGPKRGEECGDPRTKEQIKPRRVCNTGTEKPRLFCPSLPHVLTINGFQSSITCLPSYSIKRRHLPHSSPYTVYMPHPISKRPTISLSHSLDPGYKSGPGTPVQCWFSLEPF